MFPKDVEGPWVGLDLSCGGGRVPLFNVGQLVGINAFAMEVNDKSEEDDLSGKEIGFVFVDDHLCLGKTFDDGFDVLGVFLTSLGEDDNVVNEYGDEGEIAKDPCHAPLKKYWTAASSQKERA